MPQLHGAIVVPFDFAQGREPVERQASSPAQRLNRFSLIS